MFDRFLAALRVVAGAIALGLAVRWTIGAVRPLLWPLELRALERIRGRYGVDPDSGLTLRILPLTPAERAAALERESDPSIAATSVHL